MMRRESRGRVVHAEGIRFRDSDYLAPELGHYRKKGIALTVGYLTRERHFIDVFDHQGDWICRAWDRELLTEGQRFQILQARKRDRQLLSAIDALAKEDLRHDAATDSGAEYDNRDFAGGSEDAKAIATVTLLNPPGGERSDPTTARPLRRRKRQLAPAISPSADNEEQRSEELFQAAQEGRRRKAERDRLNRDGTSERAAKKGRHEVDD